MKKLPLFLLTALAFAACEKPAAEEDAATPKPRGTTPAAAKRGTPAPAPQPGDWMWKNTKGTPRSNDPLRVKDNALDATPKKK
jgi:hypothetical protein